MKLAFPLCLLLLLPQLALAQPAPPAAEGQAQPALPDFRLMARMAEGMNFAFNGDNAKAVAQMGAFYNSLQKATTYSGHWVITQSVVQDGKQAVVNSVDTDAVWQKDPQTGVFKSHATSIYTVTTPEGQVTTNRLLSVNDGTKSYRYYSDRNVWMEEPQTEKSAFNQADIGALIPWIGTLLRVSIGTNFQTKKVNDGASFIYAEDGSYGATFNADDTLQSWRWGQAGRTTGEVRFDRVELNKPLPADAFVWQVPQGAQQIPPEEPNQNFQFNFKFDL